jgi:hypothetical protein
MFELNGGVFLKKKRRNACSYYNLKSLDRFYSRPAQCKLRPALNSVECCCTKFPSDELSDLLAQAKATCKIYVWIASFLHLDALRCQSGFICLSMLEQFYVSMVKRRTGARTVAEVSD